MSSHHFVREGQEPALLILDVIALERMEPLLEWAPTVIVTEKMLNDALTWGIKIDVAVVDTGQLSSWKERLLHQAPIKILTHQPQEDALETAFHFLISTKQKAVNIITQKPDVIMKKSEGFLSHLNVVLLSEDFRWLAIPSGHFEKWVPARTQLSISHQLPVTLEGLVAHDGKYEAVHEGLISIRSEANFWVQERL
ncbi:MAG: hypothetical protein JNM57_15500 [Cyclobacteriaceae bacterium]|nr:hypothetical protein [Cyclobacteriaceae bacterium]